MARRDYPYSSFNFIVNLGGETGDGTTPIGGFSDVQGLNTEVNYADYRPGNYASNAPQKVPTNTKPGTVTLKRGVMGTLDLWHWLKAVRDGIYSPRPVTITMQDETHQAVFTWKLTKAQPQKWTAPPLAGKGGTDVAVEELVLVYETFEVEAS
jgi:phage tail-like protein